MNIKNLFLLVFILAMFFNFEAKAEEPPAGKNGANTVSAVSEKVNDSIGNGGELGLKGSEKEEKNQKHENRKMHGMMMHGDGGWGMTIVAVMLVMMGAHLLLL